MKNKNKKSIIFYNLENKGYKNGYTNLHKNARCIVMTDKFDRFWVR